MNDNAYKINLPRNYEVSATFNEVDLTPYLEDDHLVNLRANSPQQGEHDGGPSKGPHEKPQDSLEGSSSSPKVKEKVLPLLDQLAILPRLRDMHKPNFVSLLEGDPEGIISCTPHPHLDLNFTIIQYTGK